MKIQKYLQLSFQNLLQFIAKKQLQRIQKQYKQIHDEPISVVVVVGTVGKSSVTMLINKLFQNNDYHVISGTSQTKNLNSLTGLVMTLGGFYVELSTGIKIWQIQKLLFNAFLSILSPRYDLSLPTALVLEVGYDYQNESKIYVKIFESIDLLVVSSCTWEHNQGFDSSINRVLLDQVIPSLSENWQNYLNNNLIDTKLRNIAIEQLNLAQNAKYIILPEDIGRLSNTIVTNIINQNQSLDLLKNASIIELLDNKSKFFVAKASSSRVNGILVADKYIYNSKYFLPNTFARTSLILESVANAFEFEKETVKNTIANCELPFGRFGRFMGVNSSTIIDSTYNSDPASLNGLLDSLEEVINNPDSFGIAAGHILIFGEMRELGDTAMQEHNDILGRIIKLQEKYLTQILEVILIGSEWHKLGQKDNKSNYIKYLNTEFIIFESPQKICEYLDSNQNNYPQNSWYWVKGSQNTIFLEVVTKHLLRDQNDAQYLCRQEQKWDKLRV